jgi:hypothetical protein
MILALTVVLALPIILLTVKQFLVSSKGTWVSPPEQGQYLYFIFRFLNHRYAFDFVAYTLSVAVIIFLINLIATKVYTKGYLKEPLLLLLCFGIPYSAMYVLSFKVPMFIDRYILFNTLPLYLFIGVVISRLLHIRWYLQMLALPAIVLPVYLHMEILPQYFYYRDVKSAVKHASAYMDEHTVVFLHPAWSDLEFAYHYKPDFFKNVTGNELDIMLPDHIYPIYAMGSAKEILQKSPNIRRVIFYCDGTDFNDTLNRIPVENASDYIRIDSAFYRQCIYVLVYQRRENRGLLHDQIR